MNEDPNVLDTENEEEDDDEDDEENEEEEEGMEEDDDEDMEDTTSQDPVVLNFGEILKKIHEIMKVCFCSIHLEHIDVNMFGLNATIFFF